MKKVLIADDELLFRSSLRNMIENEMDGYYVCGQAGNGSEALQLIREKKPDLLITDVKMPGMDGVELTEKLRKSQISLPVIAVSNYDDYHYVKDILKNGAVDYILKHELNSEILKEQLSRILLQADREQEENRANDYVRENRMVLKREFLNRLLSGQFKDEEAICQHMKILDISLGTNRVMTCLMALDKYAERAENQTFKQMSTIDFALINILEEVLKDSGDGLAGELGNGRFLLLFSFDNQYSQAKIQYRTNALLSRISMCAKNYLNDTASFCMDYKLRRITEVQEAYEYTRKLMEQRFFYEGSCIIEKEDTIEKVKELAAGLSLEHEKSLVNSLEENSGWEDELSHIFLEMESCRMSLFTAKMILSDLFGILNRLLKKYSISYEKIYGGRKTVDEIFRRFATVSDARKWFTNAFRKLQKERMEEADENGKSYYTKELICLVKKNYSQDISLSQAALKLNISTGYLSRMFKEEMQIGFAEYLTDYRIKMCIHYMKEHKYTLTEISSMCGFRQYPYFINVFKKKTGMTPKAYIEKIL